MIHDLERKIKICLCRMCLIIRTEPGDVLIDLVRSAKEDLRCRSADAATEVKTRTKLTHNLFKIYLLLQNKSTSSIIVWKWCALSHFPTHTQQNEMIKTKTKWSSFVWRTVVWRRPTMEERRLAASLLNDREFYLSGVGTCLCSASTDSRAVCGKLVWFLRSFVSI